jgi:glutathione S-transferase
MAQEPGVRLYELALGNGVLASPFVWRVRFALAHKGIPFESVPLGFTDIARVLGPDLRLVPVLEDHKGRHSESWDIVEYLDQEHPERPLFSSAAERALARFFDAWFSIEIMRRMFGLYVLDVHNAARAEDREYFRESRQARTHGQTLEAFTADREARLPVVREALAPLRLIVSRTPYIGGDSPGYADYIALGGFRWVASVSTLPLLSKDDPLCPWLERGLDLYDGMARDPRLLPLSA